MPIGYRKQKRVGHARVTVTHRGVSLSQRVPGTGLSVSSKRGLTWFGRKPWKKTRGSGCAAALLALVALAILLACGTATPSLVPLKSSPATQVPNTAAPTLVPTTRSAATQEPTKAPAPSLVPTTRSAATQEPAPSATLVPTAAARASQPPTATPAPARASWPCPTNADGALYIGNSNSMKFHTVAHAISAEVAAEHRVCFSSRQAALDAGYVPCGTCKP